MKYRKRPVIIEALELRWDNWNEMCDFAGVGRLEDGKPCGEIDAKVLKLFIPTLEGLMTATQGDFIIRGIQGEYYPCKPDIFEATYEKVED